jgi:mannose PTS system EIIA component
VIGIVIVAHGGWRREYLAAVEHVVGKQNAVRAISISPDHDRAAKQAEICAAADSVDLATASWWSPTCSAGRPPTCRCRACRPTDRRIVYGANLPLLIKLAKSRHLPVAEAVASALIAGRKYIDSFDASVG